MALIAKGNKIIMDAYDYGVQLPFDITGAKFNPTDKMRFEIRKSKDSEILLSKDYSNELDSVDKFRFFLELTQEESSKIAPNNYIYYVRYIVEGNVRDTVASGEEFKVKNGNG